MDFSPPTQIWAEEVDLKLICGNQMAVPHDCPHPGPKAENIVSQFVVQFLWIRSQENIWWILKYQNCIKMKICVTCRAIVQSLKSFVTLKTD